MGDSDINGKLQNALAALIKLTAENERLRTENRALRVKVIANEKEPTSSLDLLEPPTIVKALVDSKNSVITALSSKSDKIALFQSLFRGREDVYPTRQVSKKTGKSGYSPAVKDPWKGWNGAGIKRDKPDPSEYLPLNEAAFQDHLEGRAVIGVYPMLRDETCWFLAADFDGAGYEKDVSAFSDICAEMEVPVYIERSRSCNGAHAWIFFKQQIAASTARKLGFAILTRAMERRSEIALKSYDRFFPNQDTMPKGGFSNLIALPLQKEARERGGSVFVDSSFQEFDDQWALLSSIKRVPHAQIERLVNVAQSDGSIVGLSLPASDDTNDEDPWARPPSQKQRHRTIVGPFPETVRVIQSGTLFIEKQGLSASLLNAVRRLAAFQNPEFFQYQAMRQCPD